MCATRHSANAVTTSGPDKQASWLFDLQDHQLIQLVNDQYDLGLEIPEKLKLFQLSEQHRRLVVINVSGLRRSGGSLLPSYTEEEFAEATFSFVKYYVQSEHYDELKERVKKLEFELEQELAWRNRTDEEQV